MDKNFISDIRDTANVNLLTTVLDTEKENAVEVSAKAKLLFAMSPAKELFNADDMAIVTILVADTTYAAKMFMIMLMNLLDLYRYRPKTRETKDWKIAYDNAIIDFQQAFFLALETRSAKSRDITLSVLLESLGKTQFLKDKVMVPESLMNKMRKAKGENEEGDEF